ncbi:MAG: CinA family protein [Deltaproteobacteria bacterium]|nr:CinA family protein [Deltaproteobacteria bacterium]MCL5878383.1 CinA family protein [Deltaproteobacteria bacterium]
MKKRTGIKNLAYRLGKKLISTNKTISTAESCTGGMIAKFITDIPGSSKYYKGGIVSYSNETKVKILGVDNKLLEKHGAVSKDVAIAMVKGVQKLMQTDFAVAVTGIAGPDGGTYKKPVGLVYIAAAYGDEVIVKRFSFYRNRDLNRRLTTFNALKMVFEKTEE